MPFGIRTSGLEPEDREQDQMLIIIPKGTVYPTTEPLSSRVLYNLEDYQENFDVRIIQGDSEFATYCDEIGKWSLEPIPRKLKGQVGFICKLSIDDDGIVTPELQLISNNQAELDAALMTSDSKRMND